MTSVPPSTAPLPDAEHAVRIENPPADGQQLPLWEGNLRPAGARAGLMKMNWLGDVRSTA